MTADPASAWYDLVLLFLVLFVAKKAKKKYTTFQRAGLELMRGFRFWAHPQRPVFHVLLHSWSNQRIRLPFIHSFWPDSIHRL